MRKEIEIAAKWWADQLREKPKHDNGEPMHNMMFAILASHMKPIEPEKIDKFEKALVDVLLRDTKPDEWRPEEPNFASYGRGLGVDYGPAGRLVEACEAAGIEDYDNRFPVKTHMWINPGEVKVSCGYRAPIETLYEEKKT